MAWRRQAVRRVISAVTLTALAACSGSETPAGGGAPSGSRPGGAIDSAFGTGGTAAFGSTSNDTVNAALGTSTDATVVVGSSLIGDKAGFLLMRVRGDGSLDPTFGTEGRTVSHVGLGSAEALAAGYTAEGKIVVAGSAANPDGGDADIALARYSADGVLDAGFGRGGSVVHRVSSGPDTAFALAVDHTGRIVVAGQCGRANVRDNTRGTACVARFSSSGEADAAFGPSGSRLLPLRDGVESLRGVAVDGRGRITAAGYSAYGTANEVTLFRLTEAGALDDDFGDLGSVTYRGRGFSDAFALALLDGGVLVAGFSGQADGTEKDFLLARFSIDGKLDPTFGDGGVTTTAIGSGDDVAFALSAGDQGILLGGYAFNGKDNDMAVARYSNAGRLDGSFGNGGTLTFPRGAMAVARGVVVAGSTITLAGELKTGDGRGAMLARVRVP